MVLIEGSPAGGRPPRPTTTLSRRVEEATGLDAPAETVGKFAQKLAGTGGRRDLLSGTWLGHPVHPLLVALPIGTWSAASLLDLTGQRKAARTLVGAGILATLPTAATGLSDWSDTTGAERRVGLVHMAANTLAATAYSASYLARRRGRHGKGAALALIGAAITGVGGWFGGHLSYALGVGVDTNAFDGGPTEWTPLEGDVPADGPAGGTLVQASAAGTAVAVARTTSGVRAIADRCSHRGGPLSDGTIEGGCVTCPWHGSRFDLDSGEVVQGPAVVPQPTYEARTSSDGWEVRRNEERTLRTNPVGPLPSSGR